MTTQRRPIVGIDKIEVVESFPGIFAVDAYGIKVRADSLAEAVAIVQSALVEDPA